MADEFDAAAGVASYLGGGAPTPEQTLRTSLLDAVAVKPDYEADLRKAAQATGVPIETARTMPDYVKQQQALAGIDTSSLAKLSPVTTNFLSNPVNAAISHDDTANMGLIETLANSFRRGVPALRQGLAGTALRSNQFSLAQFDAIAKRVDAGEDPGKILASDDPMGVAYMTPAQRAQFRAQITTPLAGNIATVAQAQKDQQAIPMPDVVQNVTEAKTWGDAWSAFTQAPVQFIAAVGPQSMVANAPGMIAAVPAGLAAGPGAAAAVMGAGSYAADYGSSIVEALTSAGVDVSNAAQLEAAVADPALMQRVAKEAYAHAAVVGAVDALSGGVASKVALPQKVATRLAAKPVARELASMTVQTPVQGVLGGVGEAGGEIAAGQDLSPGNILAEVVGEAFSAPGEVAAIASRQVIERVHAAQAAEVNAQRVEDLTKLVEASKLRERDPETFAAFVDQIAEGANGNPSELYIDAQTLVETLNQAGIGMAALQAAAPSIAEQLQPDTFMPGADIRLPVSDLLVAPAELTQPLVDHLRASPEAMSREEARVYLEQQRQEIQQAVESALSSQEQRDQFAADVKTVQDHFQAQLDEAGKFRPGVNKAYATLLGNFYATQALRAGIPLVEFMDKYQLGVTAKTPQQGATLEQGAKLADVTAGWEADGIESAVSERNGVITVSKLVVPESGRGVGKGTAAMKALIDYADATGQHIALTPSADFGGDKKRLTKFYKGLGFVENKGKNRAFSTSESMYRQAPGKVLHQGARGTLSFAPDITTAPSVIALLEGADLSTFLHESGHFFLEVQADMAARIAAKGDQATEGEQQILADFDKLLGWFGITGTPDQSALSTWLSMSTDERREHHEQFARSFERYAMEGKAPSQELAGVFQRFRSWLVSVYRTLVSLNSNLDDDVRKVMDRMIASDAAIAATEAARGMGPLFESPEKAGMTPEEYAAYQALGAAATGVAEGQLDERLLKDMKWLSGARSKALKAAQAQADAQRNAIEAQVRAEVMSQPVYRAWDFLTSRREKVVPGKTQIEGIDPELESGKLRTSLVKEIDPAAYEILSARGMTSENAGMHPDIVAEMFGYTSGDQLVEALATAQPPDVVIEGMTDQRMLEEHGDITSSAALNRAADEAVHNELRARVIAAELAALTRATRVREESPNAVYGARNTVDVMARAAREHAANVIARIQLKNLRHKQYTAAEARSAKLAMQSLGNTAEAAMHKRNQLVNNYAAKAAFEAEQQVRKENEFFKRVMKGNAEEVSKTRDFGIVQAARAVLAAYGIGSLPKGESANSYLEVLAKNDPGMHSIIAERIAALLANAKPVQDLTVEEFRGMAEEVHSLWFLAKRSRQVEIDGKLIDRAEVEGEITARLTEIGVPATIPGEGRAVTDAERWRSRVQTLGAALRRVETWVGIKDGQDIGAFRKYIWQPVKEAADRYRADKAKVIKQYKALLDTVDLGKQRIEAPELGYTFGFSKGGSGKAEILHAILHTGNDSNKRKLLLGRKWASENVDGTLDTSRWDAFVQRMIDQGVLGKADFDFAQGVWDLLEATKPLAQKAHRDVFGHYFAEVTANEFSTPFGTYRGGYVPAMADPEVVKDAATRALQEDENSTLAYAFPSTSKGFTKSRVEYNRPLLLDLRTLATHVDKVLLFSHLEQPVRDVRRILAAPGVSTPLHRIDPQAYDGLLTPWLNRAARQTVETRVPGDNNLMRGFSIMRQRAGMAAMFANVSNTVQQVTGLSLAALKVRPKYLMDAVAQYIIAPRQTARTVAASSVYMETRLSDEAGKMENAINEILLNPGVYGKAVNWTNQHTYFLQSAFDNVLGPIIWTGAYNQALEAGHSDKDAVRLADSAIRETQGSTLPEDVSRIETGNAFVRMFTQFAGYFNMQANLMQGEFAKMMHSMGLRQGMGRGLYIFTFGFLVPNMVAEAISLAFKGGPDDEDKDGDTIDDWLWSILLMANVKGGLAMVPILGQTATAALGTLNSKPYDDRISTSPAISMVESAVRAPRSVYEAAFNGGDGRKAVRDLATLIAMTVGLPATAIARPLGYTVGVSENRVAPTSAADAVRGLVTGTPSPESKR